MAHLKQIEYNANNNTYEIKIVLTDEKPNNGKTQFIISFEYEKKNHVEVKETRVEDKQAIIKRFMTFCDDVVNHIKTGRMKTTEEISSLFVPTDEEKDKFEMLVKRIIEEDKLTRKKLKEYVVELVDK